MESRRVFSFAFQTTDYSLKSTDFFRDLSWRRSLLRIEVKQQRPETKYLKNHKRFKDHEGPRRPTCLEFSMPDVDFVRLSSILCVRERFSFESKT